MYGDDEISLQCLTAFDDAGTSFRVGVIDVPGCKPCTRLDDHFDPGPIQFLEARGDEGDSSLVLRFD